MSIETRETQSRCPECASRLHALNERVVCFTCGGMFGHLALLRVENLPSGALVAVSPLDSTDATYAWTTKSELLFALPVKEDHMVRVARHDFRRMSFQVETLEAEETTVVVTLQRDEVAS